MRTKFNRNNLSVVTLNINGLQTSVKRREARPFMKTATTSGITILKVFSLIKPNLKLVPEEAVPIAARIVWIMDSVCSIQEAVGV